MEKDCLLSWLRIVARPEMNSEEMVTVKDVQSADFVTLIHTQSACPSS